MDKCFDLGIYGLGTMGRALALNLLGKGASLAVWSRSPERRRAFEGSAQALSPGFELPSSLGSFVASLSRPRKLFLILPSEALEEVLDGLLPILAEGDILVDGGASDFRDSIRRSETCATLGIHYVDLGISGGAEELRQGPVFMAGASPAAWEGLKACLELAAARDGEGRAAVARLGPPGAGHLARMAQASVEYADLELLAETYNMMRSSLRLSPEEMRTVYSEWNKTEASSRLLGLTADILGVRDGEGLALVDLVLDSPGPEARGAWAPGPVVAMGFGLRSPQGLLGEAISMRNLAALKDERVMASALLGGPKAAATGERQILLENLRKALLAARLLAYAQTFILLRGAEREFGWGLDLQEFAGIWGGSRSTASALLATIREAYQRDGALPSPLLDSKLKTLLDSALPSLRKVSSRAVEGGLPMPVFTSALAFYDAYRSTWLPANLVQALRDGLGGLGYERIDRPRGEIFHSEWK